MQNKCRRCKRFFTQSGTVKFINVPGGRGVRIDTALYTNYKVNPHYDSLILKIVSKGKDRNESISIMKRALDEIIIDGINTNIELHKWILNQNDFINGIYNTNWLEKNISKFNQQSVNEISYILLEYKFNSSVYLKNQPINILSF